MEQVVHPRHSVTLGHESTARAPNHSTDLPPSLNMNRSLLFTAATGVALGSIASAQVTNDDCATAAAAPLGATAFDTTLAIDEGVIPFNCAANGGPDIWYTYTAASTNNVAIDLCGSSYDTGLTLYSGTCAAPIEIICNDDFCGLQSGATLSGVSVGDQFLIRIAGFNGGTGFGTLNIAEVTPPPGTTNDTCATAVTLTAGNAVAYDSTTAIDEGLLPFSCGGTTAPDVWYSYTAANGNSLTFETCGSSYDTAIEVFDGNCSALNFIECNDDSCGLQSSITVATPVSGSTYYMRVGGWNGSTGFGTVLVTEGQPPAPPSPVTIVDNLPGTWIDISTTGAPLSLGDDGEVDIPTTIGNTVLAAGIARVGSNGAVRFDGTALDLGYANQTIPSLAAFNSERTLMPFWDDVDTDGGLEGEIYYQETGGVLVIQWEAVEFYPGGSGGIDTATFQIQVPSGTGPIVAQYLYESVDSFRADGGASATIGFQSGDVGGYDDNEWSFDLPGAVINGTVLTVLASPGQIGTNYCTANANSTGAAASMAASGSTVLASNDLVLEANGLPNNSFGFFLASQTQGFVANPGGSQGNLCLGGAIGRYVGPGQIQNAGTTGMIAIAMDNTQVPQPTGFVTVGSGDSWNFQAWYRDAVGGSATSNFTDGIEITF